MRYTGWSLVILIAVRILFYAAQRRGK